ncbi:MAG: diaminopimelate epimerase [Acidobacteriota bacterium]
MSLNTDFFKMSGAGNDFIALAAPDRPPTSAEIRAWCRRGLSLGADGVFTLERQQPFVRMGYYNADGERSDLCLNGCRCAVRLAFHLDWVEDGSELELETDIGVLRARRNSDDHITLELPRIIERPREISLEGDGFLLQGRLLRVGVPHLVLPWKQPLSEAPVTELGPALRAHPAVGADGANVNFVRFPTRDHCQLRTYERGVEAETLACGTGIVATVAAGLAEGQLTSPVTALTAGGHQLRVEGSLDGRKPWTLEGDARIVATGILQPGAFANPATPAWR